jgi:hypothetical protein
LVLIFILSSCSTSKITAISCPKFTGNKYNKAITSNKRNRNSPLIVHFKVKMRKQPIAGLLAGLPRKNQVKDVTELNHPHIQENVPVTSLARINGLSKVEYSKMLIASTDNTLIPFERNKPAALLMNKAMMSDHPEDIGFIQQIKCDTIVLRSGSRYIGKVEEVGVSEIKYRRCDNLNGPIISISKSDIAMISFSNGTREVISYQPAKLSTTKKPNLLDWNKEDKSINNPNRIIEKNGIIGLAIVFVGLFLGAIPGAILGLGGLFFLFMSEDKLMKNPGKYKRVGLWILFLITIIYCIELAVLLLVAAQP